MRGLLTTSHRFLALPKGHHQYHYNDDKSFPLPDDNNEAYRIDPDILNRYSGIRKIFSVGGFYHTTDPDSRTGLVSKIFDNVEQQSKKSWYSFGRLYLGC